MNTHLGTLGHPRKLVVIGFDCRKWPKSEGLSINDITFGGRGVSQKLTKSDGGGGGRAI